MLTQREKLMLKDALKHEKICIAKYGGYARSFQDMELAQMFDAIQKKEEKHAPVSEARIMLKVNDKIEHTAAMGNGPVNALDNALRKALHKFYPELERMTLIDYKVRVVATREGTEAVIRVLIQSSDGERTWETVGVSPNIIEASWQALVDSIDYKLLIEEEKRE